ncbi:hypothetical protein FA10DRAFT_262248 [Acaromyces ingoldii]|uniref:Uncharacterized protein n=1 Tax=Acaromyces ingoldii TaxID=215250 RepID=A0A316YEF2_9BASI|nr:hypothetical protein FA10DRAFT_262248 [Acaromyces ingoldii]PWN87787.1 hypothetical protein FA10DRAFT_262248 [Acaromyces ingoldii]
MRAPASATMRSLIFVLLSFTFALIATYAMPMHSRSSSTSPDRDADLENLISMGESATSPGMQPYLNQGSSEVQTDTDRAHEEWINQFGDKYERSHWPDEGLRLFWDWNVKIWEFQGARNSVKFGASVESTDEQRSQKFREEQSIREAKLQAAEREEELARERVRVWKEQWVESQKTGGGEESDSEDDQHRTNQQKGSKCKGKASDDEAEPLLAKSKKGKGKASDSEGSRRKGFWAKWTKKKDKIP